MDPSPCPRCHQEIPLDWTHCPHCGDGLRCPNVILAGQVTEQAAVKSRYDAALADAIDRGCEVVLREFENAAKNAQAVMGTTLQKLIPIVRGDRHVFATYHELAELRFLQESSPHGPDWNVVRPAAELALLGSAKHFEKLQYAALSIDGRSLSHYGDVTILLRENLISLRASLFQENSAVYVYRRGIRLPEGSRGIWTDRGVFCTAKLASKITESTSPAEFSAILLQAGRTGADDQFVEVNVFGPMTFSTFEKVSISLSGPKRASAKRPRKLRGTADQIALVDYCKLNGINCECV